tara:strand:+ start:331 stop:660 length:330 start_codon:yes stop_codon:yes gene_type:complete
MKYELKVIEKNNQWEWEVEAKTGNSAIIAKGTNTSESNAYVESYNVISTIKNHKFTARASKTKRKPYMYIGMALLLSGIIRGIGVAIGFDMVIPWESIVGILVMAGGKL